MQAINPLIPGYTTEAERASIEITRGLRASDPSCGCRGVALHGLLVHSAECRTHFLPSAEILQQQQPKPQPATRIATAIFQIRDRRGGAWYGLVLEIETGAHIWLGGEGREFETTAVRDAIAAAAALASPAPWDVYRTGWLLSAVQP